MAFQSAHVKQLIGEEKRLISKFENKAKRIMAENRSVDYPHAFHAAVKAFPVAYRNYVGVRAELSQLGIPPQPIPNLGLQTNPTRW